ncbi:MAG: hypothetical protein WAN11_12635 [Syntrophobacteraceae bacterium]
MNDFDFEALDEGFLAFLWRNLSPIDRAHVTVDSPKTAWVFGAGASHHYNLNARGVPIPLANGFFQTFNKLPTSEGFQAHVGPLISFLNSYRGIKPDEAMYYAENIEDFMTSVEAELGVQRELRRKAAENRIDMQKVFSLASAFNNMTFICASVVNEAQNGPSESIYRYLLDFCGPNDTFITFNWDTLLDRALADSGGWTPNNGYGVSFSSALDGTWKDEVESSPIFTTQWKLLKLHGSTNWLVPYTHVHLQTFDYVSSVPESDNIFLFWQSTLPYATFKQRWRGGYAPTCYGYYPPNIPGSNFTEKQLSPGPGRMFVEYTPIRVFSPFKEPSVSGIASSPLLITPVRQKRYDIYQSKMEPLWQEAAEAMKVADKIVIIGYSFPPTDSKPLELLTNAIDLRKRDIKIEIVAPHAKNIASRIGEAHLVLIT